MSDITPPETDKSRELRKSGYVELGKVVDDDTVSEIYSDYEGLLETEDYARDMWTVDGEVYSRSIDSWKIEENIIDLIPALSEVINDEVREVLEGYYGSHIRPVNFQLYRYRHVPEEIYEESWVNSGGWHVDGFTTDHVKLHMYLNDVEEENGPYRVQPKSNSKKVMRQTKLARKTDVYHDEDIHLVTGEAGTGILSETAEILHRAGNPQPGEIRDMLQVIIAPSSSEIGNWEENLREQGRGISRLARY